MTQSFLSYVARQHGLTFEDVATDALAHVLQNSQTARSALRKFLNSPTFEPLPERFWVETRVDTQDCGIPDLLLRDEDGVPCVIIEAKFTAGLTDHQPVSYLSYLRRSLPKRRAAMLVFLVPESKKAHYEKKLRERCSNEDVRWETNEITYPYVSICLKTWRECLAVLRAPEQHEDFDIFLRDLERMCSVAEPDKFEEMTGEEIAVIAKPNCNLAARVRNFMDLANEIARRAFTDSLKSWSKYDNAWGATWCGVYGKIANADAWIGVDTAAWSEYGISPIWLELQSKNRASALERQLKTLRRDDGYFVRSNGKIGIPVLLSLGNREETLENCCKQIDDIRRCLQSD